MSNFSGINNFGSLTTQNGTRLTFKDFDLDGDNKVTKEEYEQVLKDNNIDQVELSSIDKDGNQELSEDEFAVWEQKTKMQDIANDYIKKQKDFVGKDNTVLAELSAGLKDLIEKYAEDFPGKVEDMAATFETELPEKYQELKATVLANDPATIKSNILDDIAVGLRLENPSRAASGEATLTENAIKTLMKTLQAEANTFIKNYTGDNLAADLKAYLEEVLNKSDSEKMQDALNNYYDARDSYGAFVDDNELEGLKESAKELLQIALDKGITVKLGDQTITASNIDRALSKYNDADDLTNAIETFIANLSQLNKKEQVVTEEAVKSQKEAEAALTTLPGSAYQVSIDDLTLPQDYYENKTKSKKGKGQDYYKTEARETLDAIKEQIKEQITATLEAKGIPFEQIENIFENVYTITSEEAINEAVSGRHGTWFRREKSEYNVKDLIDKFVTKFNAEIEKQIDAKNKSDKDMDVQDLNYSVIAQDENGKVDEDMLKLLKQGGTMDIASSKADAYIENMIQKLKPQLLSKARAMCAANGIEFDQKAFDTRFDSCSKATIANSNDDTFYYNFICKLFKFNKRAHLNPQEIVKAFITEFSASYTTWVEGEKVKK